MNLDPALINLGATLALLVATYFTGSWIERRHYRSIRSREERWARLPAINFRSLPPAWSASSGGLVAGNVVISVDYFKRFLASLRHLVGGRVKAYESLLDRARREALLRLKADAIGQGYHAVINVRIETSRMANGRGRGEGIAGIEVLAFGTGLKLSRPAV